MGVEGLNHNPESFIACRQAFIISILTQTFLWEGGPGQCKPVRGLANVLQLVSNLPAHIGTHLFYLLGPQACLLEKPDYNNYRVRRGSHLEINGHTSCVQSTTVINSKLCLFYFLHAKFNFFMGTKVIKHGKTVICPKSGKRRIYCHIVLVPDQTSKVICSPITGRDI